MNIIKIILLLFLITSSAYADSQAVILIYHRVGDPRYPTTNVTSKDFSKQMQWLEEHNYHVLSLSDIVNAIRLKKPLPEHTVGISFHDAYRSVYDNAWPILNKYHYPFTVFVATEPVRRHFGQMMRWSQLAEMVKHDAEIGNHTATHAHLTQLSSAELRKEIMASQAVIKKYLKVEPTLFAYPFGEYNKYVQLMVQSLGFKAAFAQVSGAVSDYSDLYALPRFPLNEHYSNIKRFAHIVRMKALNVTHLSPKDTFSRQNPP
jgi:peptidoglycan/xylan/chitin deacetylase (PgdA/CDA1 family)